MPTNVLLIVTDQHRYDVVSTHPGSSAITPAVERLASEGTVFDHCYSPSPVCSPARASILTGQLPSRHGLWANGCSLPDHSNLVSRELSLEGYRCGLVGKLHLATAFSGRTEPRGDDGFEVFRWAHDPFHGSPENAYHAWLREQHPDLWRAAGGDLVTPDTEDFHHADTAFDAMPVEAHYSTWVAEETVDFLRTSDDRPFFLMVNFYDPHHPFVAPPELLELYPPGSVPPPVGGPDELAAKPSWQRDASEHSYAGNGPSYVDFTPEGIDEIRRSYYAMVTLVDQNLARILETLDETGQSTDTLVIFTSDHGEMLGDHAMLLKGAMMYDCAVRVPLVLRWPGQVPAGHRTDDMVGIHDIATTVRAATGLASNRYEQGLDLVDVAAGRRPGRDHAVSEYRDSGYPTDPAVSTTMFRTATHKLVVTHSADSVPLAGELYDVQSDPDELHNRFDDPNAASVRFELMARLLDHTVRCENHTQQRENPW